MFEKFDVILPLQVLHQHHRLHASPLGCMAQWCVFAKERALTNQAQDVHCHRCQSADHKVGVKLAAWQTLQVHVGPELGMEPLVRDLRQPRKGMVDTVFV